MKLYHLLKHSEQFKQQFNFKKMKKERNDEVIIRTILNKMLEPHGIDLDYIMSLPQDEHGRQMIEGAEWFRYYTMTQEQHDEWKKWTLEYLKTTFIPKNRHAREFVWFDLMYGLKIQD